MENQQIESPPTVVNTPEKDADEQVIGDEPDDVKVSMYLAQYKGKALAKALKHGVRDTNVLSQLVKKNRQVGTVLAKYVKNADVIKTLVDSGVNLKSNPALLVYAAHEGAEDTIEVLLDAGMEPSSQALHVAISEGHLDSVQLFVSKGVKITDNVWKTVLNSGNMDLLSLLIPAATDDRLTSLLNSSIEKDHHKIVSSILFGTATNHMKIAGQLLVMFFTSPKAQDKVYRKVYRLHNSLTDEDMAEIEAKAKSPEVVKLLKRYRK